MLMYTKFILFITYFVAASFSTMGAVGGCMDTDNKLWLQTDAQRNTYDQLMGLMACPADVDKDTARQIDAVACNWFVAKAVSDLYGVEDFSPKTNGKWLTANEIAGYVRSHLETWSKLGMANSQMILKDAASGAGNRQPVIALMTGDPHGHVALVLPGGLQPSSTWKDAGGRSLNVPNSAAFSLDRVDKAYVFCRLSAAFADPSKVEMWFRVR